MTVSDTVAYIERPAGRLRQKLRGACATVVDREQLVGRHLMIKPCSRNEPLRIVAPIRTARPQVACAAGGQDLP